MNRYKRTAIILLLWCLEQTSVHGQVGPVPEVASLKLSADKIYIFSRGTRSKAYLLAEKFNLGDTNSTHVGIGYYQDPSFIIYNVIDEVQKGRSALVVHSLDSFLSSDEIFYFSLWECANTAQDLASMKQMFSRYVNRKITFDVQFRLAQDDTLYCSEFCAQVLNNLGWEARFLPLYKSLNNPLFEAFLGRKNIRYYPVDFFQTSPFVRKVYEWRKG